MKCDDDTFVRLESVMAEVRKVPAHKSLYIGNINFYHKPLREGKWAVTYEVTTNSYYHSFICLFVFIIYLLYYSRNGQRKNILPMPMVQAMLYHLTLRIISCRSLRIVN